MTIAAENILKNYLAAVRRVIDPHRTLLSSFTPYVVAGSIGPARREFLIAGASAADAVDADYIHLEFEPGAESDGPVNVAIGMVRSGVLIVRENCRFWLGTDGQMALVSIVGSKSATMTFGSDGMDSRPGLPTGRQNEAFERARSRLRELSATPAPANDTVTIRVTKAA